MTTRTRAPAPEVSTQERTTESRRRADRARAAARAEQAEPAPEQTTAPRVDYSIGNMSATPPTASAEAGARPAGATTGEETVSQPQLPPVPEPGVTAEQVAQRQEEIAAAQSSLNGAQDTPALMNAFASAPPTIKAQVSGQLGNRASSTLNQETTAISENTPDISVEMNGNTPAPAGTIESPAVNEVNLEPSAPAGEPQAETVVGEAVANEGDYASNDNISSLFTSSFSPESGAADVERALGNLQTTDPSIATSPGSPPPVPQEGETDPTRFQNQQAEGDRLAAETLAQQQSAVQTLPGVERVQLASVHETRELGELAPPVAEEAAAPEGAQQYLNYNQPPEVQTAFDDLTGAQMQQSMTEAQAQVDAAAQERDIQHQSEVDSAQQQANDARDQANRDQQTQVSEAECSIETQRQTTEEQQQTAVENMQQEAETRRDTDRQQFDDRVTSDQQQVDQRYTQAETDAASEVQRGERDAEAERARAERESESQSWWEKAVDFISDLFDALVAAINSIFDAVRAAVNRVLDAVRDFAIGLIRLAAEALKGIIEAYGNFLKGLVQGLLGEIFPELARVLTEAIDSAVALASRAIDAVANWLIEAVNAIVEAMRRAIMALINIYQAAINTALALARAALTGDWTGFIIQLIEAACRVAGLDPQQIFDIIGRARDTIQIIVDDPFAFFSNLINALVGGVRLFATNFVTHLQAGIINWLTGTIGGAGITLPERWDVMGVIGLVAQILGLTWENLRIRIVRFVGERGVQVLEFVASYVQTLITGGWSGLWERIQQDLTTIKDIVFEQIRNYLVERIIVNAIMYLATLWEPVGWLVNFVIGAYRFYTFVRDQFQRILGLVTTIVEAVSNIAHGILDPAQQGIERFLANLLPLAIDLLARLLGLGNIGGRVREIITSVQETIWRGIDRLIERVVGMFRGGAANAAGTPAAAGAEAGASDVIRLSDDTFEADVTHHLYIEIRGSDAVVIMASNDPGPIPAKLEEMDTRARVVQKAETREEILGKIAVARTQHSQLEPAVERLFMDAFHDHIQARRKIPLHEIEAQKPIIESRIKPQKDALKTALDNALTEIDTALKGAKTSTTLERFEAYRGTKAQEDFKLQPVDTERFGLETTVNGTKAIVGYKTSSKRPFFRDDYMSAMQTELQTAELDVGKQGTLASYDLTKGVDVKRMSRVGDPGSQRYAFTDGAPGYAERVIDLTAGKPHDPTMAKVVTGAIYVDSHGAVTKKGIISFMESLARTGQVTVDGITISRADFDILWQESVNASWIADRFRDAFSGQHEWIPSHLIDQVIARASKVVDGAAVGKWVGLQHEMRSDTSWVIFKLNLSVTKVYAGQQYSAIQGHSGAMYLAEGGKNTPQTVGQPAFHDELEKAFGNPSQTITQCIDAVIATFDKWVWDGAGSTSLNLHPLLKDGKGRMVALGSNFTILAGEHVGGGANKGTYRSMRDHLVAMKAKYGSTP